MAIMPPLLQAGDTIGIICPSHIADREKSRHFTTVLESLGFRVRLGDNIYRDTYGYSATEQERAEDLNRMVEDDTVKMVLFGGGEGGNELLPYIDFDSIAKHPKLFCGFSDSTTILNAVHSRSGIVTHYGQGPGMFYDLQDYDYAHFAAHFLTGNAAIFHKGSDWECFGTGSSTGILLGGYLRNIALMLGNDYLRYDADKKYLLFLEDHEKFNNVPAVSSYLSHIEQHPFIEQVAGLVWGHYAPARNPDLLRRLERFADRHKVPVAYCDDFGHGALHGILPIGREATLDAASQILTFLA